ncbi:hypothetical protein QBC43DRAFT_314951 [Cladorrhinum sp. PSN259]|nr:hypothetical protein QBC43DRAFT_314951 [Cladorrhinum sp. PSN259]
MAVPYHLLKACGGIIVAAQGTDVHSFNSNLEHISTWQYPIEVKPTETTTEQPAAEVSAPPTPEGPPAKRRRTETGAKEGITKEQTSKEQGGKTPESAAAAAPVRKGRFHRSPVQVANESPFINCLVATNDGRHVILTTGSDKTIWVLEHDGAGNFKQLSQRPMPKRPCSISLTRDNTTILSADKFGDVYALPLIPSSEPTTSGESTPKPLPSRSATPSGSGTPGFKPQANEFTVHTRRNLRALENQRLTAEQAKQQKEANEAEKPQFEHTLLLGHVSMLTAITVGQAVSPATGLEREWIITADRDEHIRVSRGVTQAHVIDNFCLGHEDFVKALCILPGHPSVLVSGGGDDDILVWDWLKGQLISRAAVLQHVKQVIPEAEKVAVSRVFGYEEGENTKVAVIVERVPALFIYTFSPSDQILQHSETISLPGNLLDVEFLQKTKLLVTIDAATASSLIVIEGSVQTPVQNLPAGGHPKIEAQELQKLLYTTESLRKQSDFD